MGIKSGLWGWRSSQDSEDGDQVRTLRMGIRLMNSDDGDQVRALRMGIIQVNTLRMGITSQDSENGDYKSGL